MSDVRFWKLYTAVISKPFEIKKCILLHLISMRSTCIPNFIKFWGQVKLVILCVDLKQNDPCTDWVVCTNLSSEGKARARNLSNIFSFLIKPNSSKIDLKLNSFEFSSYGVNECGGYNFLLFIARVCKYRPSLLIWLDHQLWMLVLRKIDSRELTHP